VLVVSLLLDVVKVGVPGRALLHLPMRHLRVGSG
jgi:hypothetical protein